MEIEITKTIDAEEYIREVLQHERIDIEKREHANVFDVKVTEDGYVFGARTTSNLLEDEILELYTIETTDEDNPRISIQIDEEHIVTEE